MELGEAKLQQVEASRQSFKQRGWAVHFIDLTSLYLRLKIGAGRAVKARLVDSKRAASYGFYEQQAPTYSYKNEKQQAPLEEASPHQRKPLHASLLYRVPNLRTPKLQALKPLLCWDIGRSAGFPPATRGFSPTYIYKVLVSISLGGAPLDDC